MLTKRQEEQLFKLGAVISFVPFFPLVVHAYELAFVSRSRPHLALVMFSFLLVMNISLRLPYLRSTNRLVFAQVASVWAMNILILFFYLIAFFID
ncbi:hypothetical protein MITS9509_02387 [Synechococcus sp. MIT S9509]|nr:hypothetical protein MITS9504_02207 [Synechococcus sp. MIT S9504]KZR91451.1 hypothetical protein MITS9509_02387 [Synechococcus sp. MIT S9509]